MLHSAPRPSHAVRAPMAASLPLAALAEAVRRIVLAAGDKIMTVYRSDFAVRTKSDRSPVTAADEAAEAFIIAELGELSPRLPIVAEESVARGRMPEIGAQPFWLVDPLDGTKEFVSRNGEFTVNVGLVSGGKPVLGAVYAPAAERLFWAQGADAWTEHGGRKRKIVARRPDADGFVVVASRSHRDAATDAYLATLNVKRITSAGSSLKFCLVAAGEADLYPRFGPTNEWDTAAGHAVLAIAGGRVVTRDGDELVYGKPGFKNPGFVAKGLP